MWNFFLMFLYLRVASAHRKISVLLPRFTSVYLGGSLRWAWARTFSNYDRNPESTGHENWANPDGPNFLEPTGTEGPIFICYKIYVGNLIKTFC
jgi:hypothetical protein